MTIKVPRNFNPRPYQLEVLNALQSGIRRAYLCWPRRAGKDKVSWVHLLMEAWKRPGNYYYVFPEKEQAKKAFWENIDSKGYSLVDHLPEELIEGRNSQELLIRLINKSTIRVIGLDKNPNAIRGSSAAGVVLSEFAFADLNAYKTMAPALRETRGWVIFNSTPNGPNHFYEMFMAGKERDDVYTHKIQSTDPDSPEFQPTMVWNILEDLAEREGLTWEEVQKKYLKSLIAKEIKEIKELEQYDDDDIAREFGTSFKTVAKGSIFGKQIQEAEDAGRISAFPPNKSEWVDTYWDLGVNDPTAIWFAHTYGDTVTFIDYYESSDLEISDFVQILKEKGYKYRTHYMPHDARNRSIQTNKTTSAIFQAACRSAKISDDVFICDKMPQQDSINATRARFSMYRFDEGLTDDALRKLELYHRRYDKKLQTYSKEPVHDWTSHCADAFKLEAIANDIVREDYTYNVVINSDFDIFGG